MYIFYKNAQLVINFTVKNTETGAVNDPATVAIAMKTYNKEGNLVETATYLYGADPELTKISVGNYKLIHTPTEAGRLVYGITTTTPAGFYAGALVIKDNSI